MSPKSLGFKLKSLAYQHKELGRLGTKPESSELLSSNLSGKNEQGVGFLFSLLPGDEVTMIPSYPHRYRDRTATGRQAWAFLGAGTLRNPRSS